MEIIHHISQEGQCWGGGGIYCNFSALIDRIIIIGTPFLTSIFQCLYLNILVLYISKPQCVFTHHWNRVFLFSYYPFIIDRSLLKYSNHAHSRTFKEDGCWYKIK